MAHPRKNKMERVISNEDNFRQLICNILVQTYDYSNCHSYYFEDLNFKQQP
eukprot:UN11653